MSQSARKTKPMALGTSDASPSLHPCTVPESFDRLLPRIDRALMFEAGSTPDQLHPVICTAHVRMHSSSFKIAM